MDAVVTAGGIPQPNEPLYTYSRGEAKALIDVAGKPMVQWVLDALGEAHTIERVVLIEFNVRRAGDLHLGRRGDELGMELGRQIG